MLAFALPTAYALPAAATTVDEFHATLLGNMERGAALGCSGRTQKMTAAINQDFDLPFIARQVMKRNWAALSAAQQEQFTSTLRQLVILTYASNFSSHHGETFSTQDTRDLPNNARLVHSRLNRSADDPVSFDYVLHESAGQWKIINIIADGVSDLAIRSAQYNSLYQKENFSGLIGFLQKQTAKIQAGCQ
ncbi:MAG: ABC transporter substrate-binding protein [Stenotrophobium sp.]